jgi:serine-type D-Ala-D-Ala carboxypeptidase (penicillin-binding protein 5/6)
MNSTVNILIVFFIVMPLLVLSYQWGNAGLNISTASINDYLNRPPLRATLKNQARAENNMPLRRMNVADLSLDAVSVLAWDYQRDWFLYSKNINASRPIASLTKLITAAVVLDHASLQEEAIISRVAIDKDGNRGRLVQDEVLKMQDLLAAALLESSNDAAYALGENVGKKFITLDERSLKTASSSREFVRAMNRKLNELGLFESNFTDTSGLDDINSFSTASNLAHFIKYLRTNPAYQPIWDILQLRKFQTTSQNKNINHEFINNNPFLDEFKNVIGGKTGYTDLALGNMALVIKSPDNKSEIIYLVLGSYDRFEDMRKLVNWTREAWTWSDK